MSRPRVCYCGEYYWRIQPRPLKQEKQQTVKTKYGATAVVS